MATTVRALGFVHVAMTCVFLVGATLLIPPTQSEPASHTGTPLPAVVYETAALGRADAAADAVWLQVVSGIGEDQRYEWMVPWVKRVTEISPRFQEAYMMGGVLLATSGTAPFEVERLFARAESEFPTDGSWAVWRGFNAYFSAGDTVAAVRHYERALQFDDTPAYLRAFVKRLRTRRRDCHGLTADLRTVLSGRSAATKLARANATSVLENCWLSTIQTALTRYRVRFGEDANSISTLRSEGLLGALPQLPPGRCWKLAYGRASIGPCAQAEGSP